jgi:DNA-binding transcriptional LysR family regulator
MMIELRHIRYVIAVAEERHITRAAERLGIQQPPLSRQIQAIERELKVQLFRRRPRGVELTEAGRAFLDGARRLVSGLSETLDTTRRTARGEQGRVSVGLTPTAPFHPLVPRAIRAFRDAFPKVSITMQESLSGELVERMRDEQIDIAFLRTAVADPQTLTIYPLLDEPMVVALPSSHLLAQASERGIALKRLAGETFILYGPPGSGIYDETLAACRAAGFTSRRPASPAHYVNP